MNKEKFEKIVKEGIAQIPEKFLKKLDNVDIVIEDEPSSYQLRKLKSRNLRLFGLYQGVPQTKRYHYGQVLPDKITIFKKSIEEVAQSEAEIKEIAKNTIWHEIAHHFGMSEIKVRKAEYQRKTSKKTLIL